MTPFPFTMPRALLSFLVLAPATLLTSCNEPETPPPAIPDFSGYWEHAIAHYLPADEGPGPVVNMPVLTFVAMNVWVGDYRNSVLQPWASEAVRVHAVAELERGEPLWGQLQLCMPFGVPAFPVATRNRFQFLQDTEMVTILYQHDNQVRRIFLNQSPPTRFGAKPLRPLCWSL